MALIAECKKCRLRLTEKGKYRIQETCPICGCTEFRYVVDHWPKGRNAGRKQVSLAAVNLKEARMLERAITGIKYKPVAASSPVATVGEMFPDYLSWYRGHRALTTWHDVSRAWERDLKRIMGSYFVMDIEASHYSLYQTMRKGVSNRTINKELDYFSGFLHWCRREKKMQIPRVDYERLPHHSPPPIVLSPDEIVRIMTAAESEPVYHAFFLCLYTMGLRISPARGIKVEDFDFENRAVRVLQKGGGWKLLPISEHVAESVKRVIKLRKLKAEQHVFSVMKDGRPVQNVRKAIERICKRAGVVKKVNPHLFRHTLLTHLIAAGVPTRTAQDYADHKEITTTEGYTHIALENLRAAQNIAIATRKVYNTDDVLSQPEYNI